MFGYQWYTRVAPASTAAVLRIRGLFDWPTPVLCVGQSGGLLTQVESAGGAR